MKNHIFFFFRIIISAGLLFFLFAKFDFLEIGKKISSIDYRIFALVILINIFSWYINSYKWKVLLEGIGIKEKISKLFQLNLISLFYTYVLPGGQLSGEAMKCIRLSSGEDNKTRLVFSVLADKVIGLYSFIMLGLLGALFSGSVISFRVILILFFALALISPFFAYLVLRIEKISKFISAPTSGDNFIKKIYNDIVLTVREYSSARNKILLSVFVGVLFQFLNCLQFYLVSKGLSIDISLFDAFWSVSLVSILLLVPITVMGLGLREGGYAVLLLSIGISESQSISLSLIIAIVGLMVAVIGGVIELIKTFDDSKLINKTIQ